MSSAENHDSNFPHGAILFKRTFFNLKVYFIHSHLSGSLIEWIISWTGHEIRRMFEAQVRVVSS